MESAENRTVNKVYDMEKPSFVSFISHQSHKKRFIFIYVTLYYIIQSWWNFILNSKYPAKTMCAPVRLQSWYSHMVSTTVQTEGLSSSDHQNFLWSAFSNVLAPSPSSLQQFPVMERGGVTRFISCSWPLVHSIKLINIVANSQRMSKQSTLQDSYQSFPKIYNHNNPVIKIWL